MTVLIAHAEADRAAAEALEKFLERRGLFVELETGERGFRIAQPSDTIVLLVSKETVFSPYRLLMEKRALEAWADEQLVLVKLDHAFSPVGLRDLPSIDASIEAQRDIAWHAVAKQASEAPTRRARASDTFGGAVDTHSSTAQRPPSSSLGEPQDRPAPSPAPARRAGAPQAKRSAGALTLVFALLVLLVAGAATYAALVLKLRPAIDMSQVSVPPVLASVHFDQEKLAAVLPIAGPIAALILIGVVFALLRPRRRTGAVAPPPAAEAPAGDPLFVSYAHADNSVVDEVVATVVAQGRAVWFDKGGIGAGEGWAGEIVRAIRGARGVLIMCSPRAFESDHVKREVYLADRYKKPMLPVFLEPAAPPEDFEYFFAGVQWLELHKTPEGERAQAIARALKAV